MFLDDEIRIRRVHELGAFCPMDLGRNEADKVMRIFFDERNAGLRASSIKPDAPPPTPEEIARAEGKRIHAELMANSVSLSGLAVDGSRTLIHPAAAFGDFPEVPEPEYADEAERFAANPPWNPPFPRVSKGL